MTPKQIAKIFRTVADKIENGTCAVDADNLVDIANNLIHIKLNAEQTCQYLGVSRSTLQRMIIDGRVPHPYKDRGGNKYWYQDEINKTMSEYNAKYGLE